MASMRLLAFLLVALLAGTCGLLYVKGRATGSDDLIFVAAMGGLVAVAVWIGGSLS